METLAIIHRRPGERARLLLVNKFETRSARRVRRRNRSARLCHFGAVVIACSTDSAAPWRAAVTHRGVSFGRSEETNDVETKCATISQEEFA